MEKVSRTIYQISNSPNTFESRSKRRSRILRQRGQQHLWRLLHHITAVQPARRQPSHNDVTVAEQRHTAVSHHTTDSTVSSNAATNTAGQRATLTPNHKQHRR